MRRGLRQILAYWRAERRTIRQGFVALVIADLGSLVAGITLGSITETIQALPGLLVLVPAAIGMRGNIFGALGSRLGTSIHAGLYEPTRERGGVLYQNVYAVTVLTLIVSLLLAVLARVMSLAFGIDSISTLDFLVISILGGVLSSLIVGGFTLALSTWAYRREWDLDSVAAPLITAAGDMVTVPSLFLATFLVGIRWVTPVVAGLAVLATAAVTLRGLTTRLPLSRRIVRESLLVLSLAGTVDILAGLVMQSRLDHFLTYPALLILVPPFLEIAGALGGILSARLGSKLHLGAITPRGLPESVAVLDASIILLFSVRSFLVAGVTASIAAAITGLASPGVLVMMGVSLMSGLLATIVTVVVAYYAATLTYRLGLDPDNHGIPMITSTMDFAGVIALIIGFLAFGLA